MSPDPLPTSDGPDRRPPRRLGESLDRLLGGLGSPVAGTLAAVFGQWVELVGARIAEHARPAAVRDGALVVAVDDPAWASELQWLGPELAERIRGLLDDDSIERIEVRVGAPGSPD